MMSVKAQILKTFLNIFLFNINTSNEITGLLFSFPSLGLYSRVNIIMVNYSFVWCRKWDGSHLLQSLLKGTVIVSLFVHSSFIVIIISVAIDLANIRS